MYKSEITLPVFQNYPGEQQSHQCSSDQNAPKDNAEKTGAAEKIKKKIAEDDDISATSATQIYVDTFKGMVLLSGFVGSDKERQTAGEIAKSVVGLVHVKNVLSTNRETLSR